MRLVLGDMLSRPKVYISGRNTVALFIVFTKKLCPVLKKLREGQ